MVRPVAQTAARLKEAQKLGFARAFVPEATRGEAGGDLGLQLTTIGPLASLIGAIAPQGAAGRRREIRFGRQDG